MFSDLVSESVEVNDKKTVCQLGVGEECIIKSLYTVLQTGEGVESQTSMSKSPSNGLTCIEK